MQKKQRSSLSRMIADQLFGISPLTAGLMIFSLGAAPLAAQTVTYSAQDSIVDTDIRSASATSANTATAIAIDGGASIFQDSSWRQGLVRVDNLFGAGANQIPAGATILGAFYQVRTGTGGNDQSGNPIGMYRLTTGFTPATAVWSNSFGGDGVQVGIDTNATAESVRSAGGTQGAPVNFDVTSSVAFWSAQGDPNTENLGWLISHESGTDGWSYSSSNNATAANRPVFTAYYTTNTGLQNLIWNAANTTGTLDTTSGNTPWLDPLNVAAPFRTGDTILLSQDAASPVSITVDAAGVIPAATVVSHNSGTYTLSGGSINLGLTKSNAGTVVLNSANNFTSVALGGGVIESGAADALGTFGTVAMTGGGTLRVPTTQAASKDFDFSDGTIEVTGSEVFTLNGITSGTGTVNKTGSGTLTITSGTSSFTGTIDIAAGRVILSDPGAGIVSSGNLNASSIIVRDGAAFQFGASTPIAGENPDFPNSTYVTVETGGIADWYIGEDLGGVVLKGGTVNIRGGGPNLAGSLGLIESGAITGIDAPRTLNVSASGTFQKQTTGIVTLTNTDISATGPMNIHEGTLSTDASFSGTGSVFLSTPTTSGTIQFRGAQAETVAKNMFLDSAGGTIDVQSASAIKTWSGNILSTNSPSPLTKTGPGELRLTGTNSFVGPITVSAGTLSFSSGSIGSGNDLSVADGATAVKMTTVADTLSTLTLGSATGGTLQLGLDGTVTSPLLNVITTNGFTVNGTSPLSISLVGATPLGTYPLIDYDGTIGGTGFAGLSLALPPRTLGTLIHDTVNTLINLNVTGVDTVKWTGATTGAWDINTTQNWKLTTAGTATTYLQDSVPGDDVTFDDSATGSTTITLDTAVSPAGLAFSNETLNYSIAGTGKISGPTGLTKSGAGTVSIGTNNDYQGPTTVNGGTLTLSGNNALVGAFTVNSGTLNLSGTNTLDGSLTVNGGSAVIGGTGSTFNQPVTLSSGSMTLNGPNIMTAGLTNSGGTLNVDAANTINAVTLSGGTTTMSVDNALGATGTITMTNGATLGTTGTSVSSARGLTFNTGGGTIDVPMGGTFSVTGATAGNQQITKTGDGTWEIMGTTSYTGTLEILDGSVILQGSAAAPTAGDLNAVAINVRDGARFQFGQTVVLTGENPDLPANTVLTIDAGGVADWYVGEDFGGINLNGGTLNLIRGNTNTAAAIESQWTSGTVTAPLNNTIGGGGKIVKSTPDTVMVTGAGLNNTGGLDIQEGTLSTNGAITNTGDLSLGTGASTGTLQLTHTASFSSSKPVVLNGEGVVDVTQAATTVTLSGIVSGGGNLTKSGVGRLALTGAANTYTGNITVGQGSLAVNATALTATTNVAVSNIATFEAPTSGQAIFAGLNVASGGNLQFDVTTSPTSAPLSVTTNGGANLNSGSKLTITSLNLLPIGTIPLLDYDTALGGTGLTGVNLVLPPRVVGALVDNTSATQVELNITAVDFIKWNGNVSAAWDINTTSNWKQNSDNAATTYLQPDSIGDTVVFDDSATGNTNVVLNTLANPNQVTFDNNTQNYSISGTGSLGGFGGIIKNGTGNATILTNNTNTGVTTINTGTLSLGNGGTSGSLGSGDIVVNLDGNLEFNRSDDTTLTNVISGTGELIKNGAGMTILSSNSSGFTGTLTVNAGTLRLANLSGTHNFNATSIVVNNGGTFDFFGPAGNANLPGTTYVTINTGGTVNWTEGENLGGINVNGGILNLTAGATLDGTIANEFTSGTINGPSAFAGSTAVNKTTAGTVTITGSALNTTGGLNIVDGTISTDSAITNTGTLTFGDATSRGTLQLRTTTSGTINKVTLVNAGGGVLDVQESATTITSTGALATNDGATLVKAGAGELQLNGVNTYGNNTTLQVDAGTLTLDPTIAPSIGTSLTASVASGATLNLGGTENPLSNGSIHANVANNGTLTATTPGKSVGEISGTGTTTVTATGATLTANHIRQSTLNIGAGNTVTVATNGGNSGTSTVSTLSINATGKLDLNDNDLVVDNGNLAMLTAQLASGLDINGSYGNGPGITSSAFANNVDFNTVLGIAANVELGYTSFSGQTVDANDVLIKYTYYGDADLSGSVDTSTDFDLYITGLTSGGSLGGWLFGDFDYSGTVDSATDFDLYITGLTTQGGALLTAGGGNLVQAVPEPSTFVLGGLALLGFAGLGLRNRRISGKNKKEAAV